MKKLRMILVILITVSVVACFCSCSGDSEQEDLSAPAEYGIVAADIVTEYDGQPHTIKIKGLQSNDKVLYSADGKQWNTEEIAYTEPGEYTVYYKVYRGDTETAVSSAKLTVVRTELTDIELNDVKYIYDGAPHRIIIHGAQSGDAITYNINGTVYQDSPELTEVGEYTVHIELERLGSGYFNGTMTVTILPCFDGKYADKTHIVNVVGDRLKINGKEYTADYDLNGNGKIVETGTSISFAESTLSIGSDIFTKVGTDEKIYTVNAGGSTYYAVGETNMDFELTFSNGSAVITASGSELVKLPGYNYCERVTGGMIVRNYDSCDVRFSAIDFDVDITLSRREKQVIDVSPQKVLYDGNDHAAKPECDGQILYLHDGVYSDSPEYKRDPGEYTYSVLVLSDIYLPTKAECVLKIVPDLSGIYFCDFGYIEINGYSAALNGNTVTYDPDITSGTLDGKPLVYADASLEYDGDSYIKTDDVLLAISVAGESRVLTCAASFMTLYIAPYRDGTRITVIDDDTLEELICIEAQTDAVTEVKLNKKPLMLIEDGGGYMCILTKHNFEDERIIRIEII